MKTLTRGFVLSAIAAGALIATGIRFASADSQSAPAPSASPYAITIKNFAFSPSKIQIPLGATVMWTNEDSAAHTATSTSHGFDSGNLDNGQSFRFTFTKSGSYPYVCQYHPNMTGMIVVEEAPSPAPTH